MTTIILIKMSEITMMLIKISAITIIANLNDGSGSFSP